MRDDAEHIKRSLTDPRRLAAKLGLAKGALYQGGNGITVRCPAHAEKTPSCSLTRGPDGTVRVRCFGCNFSGDGLTLIAHVYGLDPRRDFSAVLDAAREVIGLGSHDALKTHPRPQPVPVNGIAERDYPPASEVSGVWEAALPVDQVEPAQITLALRGLFPTPDLARALTESAALPRWAKYQGRTWAETGHRIILQAFDCRGEPRSLRAWQVKRDDPSPKRLPPAGHKATELVLANALAAQHLANPGAPINLLVAEGEPDFLALCQAYPGVNVIGVMNGSWSEAFAERVPFGSIVMVRTHLDEAGEKYAKTITSTLKGRAVVKRIAA